MMFKKMLLGIAVCFGVIGGICENSVCMDRNGRYLMLDFGQEGLGYYRIGADGDVMDKLSSAELLEIFQDKARFTIGDFWESRFVSELESVNSQDEMGNLVFPSCALLDVEMVLACIDNDLPALTAKLNELSHFLTELRQRNLSLHGVTKKDIARYVLYLDEACVLLPPYIEENNLDNSCVMYLLQRTDEMREAWM